MTTCQNCNRLIGNLEQFYNWNGYTVCINCHSSLSPPVQPIQVETYIVPSADPLDQLAAAGQAQPTYYAAPRPVYRPPERHPLVKSGIALMCVAIPFCCLLPPIGVLFVLIGFVLFIVGLCL